MGIDEKNTNEEIKTDAFVRRMPSQRSQRVTRRAVSEEIKPSLSFNKQPAASDEDVQVETQAASDAAEKADRGTETNSAQEDLKEATAFQTEAEENLPDDKKANTSEEKTENAFSIFIKRHKPLSAIILLLILILIIVVILASVGNPKKSARSGNYMDQIRNQEIKLNDVAAIDDFFINYYTATSSGNTTDLEAMFDDPSKANITTEVSTIVSQYDNFQVYVTPGIEESDVVAFVSYDIHFDNIEATAPSVDSFYLKYDKEQAALKICSDMYTDQEILKFMNLVSYREPIRSLLTDTNNRLSDALAANKDLNNLYILMQSITESADYSEETETGSDTQSVPENETGTESESETEN